MIKKVIVAVLALVAVGVIIMDLKEIQNSQLKREENQLLRQVQMSSSATPWKKEKVTTVGELAKVTSTNGAVWGGAVFYPEVNEKGNSRLIQKDMKTGEAVTVLELGNRSDLNEGGKLATKISGVKTIGDKLLVSVGEGTQKGATFLADLNDKNFNFKKISSGVGQGIRSEFDRYWIVGQEGGECKQTMNYSLLDIGGTKAIPVTKVDSFCNGKSDELLGVDNEGRLVKTNCDNTGKQWRCQSVEIIKLQQPIEKKVVDFGSLKDKITKVWFDKADSWLIFGGEAGDYKYDLRTGKTEKMDRSQRWGIKKE